MADSTTEIDLDSVIDRLLEGMSSCFHWRSHLSPRTSNLWSDGMVVEDMGGVVGVDILPLCCCNI